ncbi:hypothetical protein QOT17_022610 [Balamuthia mandrillaris]
MRSNLDSGTIAPAEEAEEEEGKDGRKKRKRASPPPRLMSRKRVGTRGFMAPEVNACYGLEEYDAFLADTWSFGRSMQAVFMEQTRVLPHGSMPTLSKLLEEATHPQPHRSPPSMRPCPSCRNSSTNCSHSTTLLCLLFQMRGCCWPKPHDCNLWR